MQGATHMALQQWQEAAMAFLNVLSAKPADIEAYLQLGYALANLKRYGESAECFRTVAMVEPAHVGAAVYAAHYAAWACDWAQGGERPRNAWCSRWRCRVEASRRRPSARSACCR